MLPRRRPTTLRACGVFARRSLPVVPSSPLAVWAGCPSLLRSVRLWITRTKKTARVRSGIPAVAQRTLGPHGSKDSRELDPNNEPSEEMIHGPITRSMMRARASSPRAARVRKIKDTNYVLPVETWFAESATLQRTPSTRSRAPSARNDKNDLVDDARMPRKNRATRSESGPASSPRAARVRKIKDPPPPPIGMSSEMQLLGTTSVTEQRRNIDLEILVGLDGRTKFCGPTSRAVTIRFAVGGANVVGNATIPLVVRRREEGTLYAPRASWLNFQARLGVVAAGYTVSFFFAGDGKNMFRVIASDLLK